VFPPRAAPHRVIDDIFSTVHVFLPSLFSPFVVDSIIINEFLLTITPEAIFVPTRNQEYKPSSSSPASALWLFSVLELC
jgi:hypothetical protein